MKQFVKESLIIAAIALFLILATSDVGARYFKCPTCGTAYKQKFSQRGLPGQFRGECSCGEKLMECSKEASGWRDGIEPTTQGR